MGPIAADGSTRSSIVRDADDRAPRAGPEPLGKGMSFLLFDDD